MPEAEVVDALLVPIPVVDLVQPRGHSSHPTVATTHVNANGDRKSTKQYTQH